MSCCCCVSLSTAERRRTNGGGGGEQQSSSFNVASCPIVKREEEVKGNQIALQPGKTHLLESLRGEQDGEGAYLCVLMKCNYVYECLYGGGVHLLLHIRA